MVLKGCSRCNGDMRIEEDVFSRSRDLVCIQCGNHQAIQPDLVGMTTEGHSDVTTLLAEARRSKYAA